MQTMPMTSEVSVAIDLILLSVENGKLSIRLTKRPCAPYMGCWALPGQAVGAEESAETAANRLLSSLASGRLREPFLEQLYTFTEINRDPRGRVISIAYMVILSPGEAKQAFRDMEHAGTLASFCPETTEHGLRLHGEDGRILTEGSLAFDHARIISTALHRLRGKIDYTDIAYHFLADTSCFSLGEMQTIFEAVLDTSLDASNFRRFLRKRDEESGKIELSEKEAKKGRGRPAALYRLRKA